MTFPPDSQNSGDTDQSRTQMNEDAEIRTCFAIGADGKNVDRSIAHDDATNNASLCAGMG